VLAEFIRPDAPERVVARASWDGRRAEILDVADEPGLADAIRRILRPTPVVVDDPSLRAAGTAGPAMLEPGDLQWFMAAARSRAEREGLDVRLVTTGASGIGWDPAGSYRTFAESVERRNRIGSAER
jgi:hypothetical protein